MADTDRPPSSGTDFRPISEYAGPEWVPRAYCEAAHICGHQAHLDIAAIVARTGDMPADKFGAGCDAQSAAAWRGW